MKGSWKNPTATFVLGLVIAVFLTLIGSRSRNAANARNNIIKHMKEALNDNRYTPIPQKTNYIPSEQEEDAEQYKILNQTEAPLTADYLYKTVRVLCFIITTPKNHWVKAIHVKKTWGRRCNKLIFMSTKSDYILGAVELDVQEGYDYLWSKTKRSLEHIYDKYVDKYDWFLKADDDTYVIMENLRNLLKDYDTDEGHFFGCNFQPSTTISYMSGGAGYVLSRKAVIKFVEEALPDPKKCSKKEVGYEDVEMGKCLKSVGIIADDSRDEFKKHRFLALPPKHYLIPGALPKDFWWWQYIRYPQKPGMGCCSNKAISFHYIKPNDMYLFEFFLYQLQVVGVNKTEYLQKTTTTTTTEMIEIDYTSTSTQTPEDKEELSDSDMLTSTAFSTIELEKVASTSISAIEEEVLATTTKANIKSKLKYKKKTIRKKKKTIAKIVDINR